MGRGERRGERRREQGCEGRGGGDGGGKRVVERRVGRVRGSGGESEKRRVAKGGYRHTDKDKLY